MSDSVVTSRPSSIPAWKILAAIVVFTTMIAAFLFWATRLNATEKMLVGGWAPDGDELTFAGEKFYYRFFPDGTFDIFELGEEENKLDDPFGYWSANSKVITIEMKEEWDLQHFYRYVTQEPVRYELPFKNLTTTELIFEEDDGQTTFKRLKQ